MAEFERHETVSKKLNIDYFFAKPYHSWESGASDNFNGLLRQYFPKGYHFSLITEKELKRPNGSLIVGQGKDMISYPQLKYLTHAPKNNGWSTLHLDLNSPFAASA